MPGNGRHSQTLEDTVRRHFGYALVTGSLLLILALDGRNEARAQQYCAQYNDGTSDCKIPTLAECEQSVAGVGGSCVPDTTAQAGEGTPQRLFPRLIPSQQPPNQDWMPPPPR